MMIATPSGSVVASITSSPAPGWISTTRTSSTLPRTCVSPLIVASTSSLSLTLMMISSLANAPSRLNAGSEMSPMLVGRRDTETGISSWASGMVSATSPATCIATPSVSPASRSKPSVVTATVVGEANSTTAVSGPPGVRNVLLSVTGPVSPALGRSPPLPPARASWVCWPCCWCSWWGQALRVVSDALLPGTPLYILLFTLAIVFFCYFYTALVFNPKDVADNLKKSGAYIPGIRPGEQSARYIDTVMGRLTLIGSVYMTLVCLLPLGLQGVWNVPFYLGGTSLLIVVVVVMDFWSQVNSHLTSTQYEKLMKKSNLKGYGGTGLVR